MKLLSLFLASSSFAQDDEAAADKGYIGYDYGGYGYNSGYGAQPSYGAPSYGSQGYDNQGYGYSNQGYGDYGYGKFVNEKGPDDGRKGNGLWCYRCHGRLKLDATESATNNAWLDCVTNGAIVECRGDERSCLSTERRRNDKVVEFQAMCKNPEACAYLWRRNERYKPPFHLFGDQTVNSGGGPSFFDDECRLNKSKHMSMRSQWESTCTHCCKAISNYDADSNEATPTEVCNGPFKTLGENDALDFLSGPLVYMCGNTGATTCTGWTSSRVFGTDNSNWQLKNLPVFMKDHLEHSRVHPGEGRNSLPEDKFILRANQKPATLLEQADKLSPEDTDFHDDRQYQTTNEVFGHGSTGKGLGK
jgi:hypothetical protein